MKDERYPFWFLTSLDQNGKSMNILYRFRSSQPYFTRNDVIKLTELNIFIAFTAGVVSVFSPCILPMFPALLAYLTGMSVSEISEDNKTFRRRAITHTFFFLIGFSIIFIGIGFATSLLGQFFNNNQEFIRIIGSVVMIIFGMVIAGIFQPAFLMKNKKVAFKSKPAGYLGSLLVGLGFSAGWSPCLGPAIAYITSLSVMNPELGFVYMFAYIIGFSIPFLTLVFFIGKINLFKKYSQKVTIVGGYLMIVVGFILLLDWIPYITSFFSKILNW